MKLCVAVVFLYFFGTPVSLAQEILHMVTGATAPTTFSDGSGILDRITTKAFRNIGREILITALPAARAIKQANEGLSDGDLQRIAGLELKYPNLVMVPEPVITHKFSAFAIDPEIGISGWKSLRNKKVTYLRGWKIYELNIPQGTEIVIADAPEQLLHLLENNRVELALFSEWSGMYWLKKMQLKARMLSPPLKTIDLHIYLHRKHKSLVPLLSRALREMKQNGQYEQILKLTQKNLS